jgi:hypothetical protein
LLKMIAPMRRWKQNQTRTACPIFCPNRTQFTIILSRDNEYASVARSSESDCAQLVDSVDALLASCSSRLNWMSRRDLGALRHFKLLGLMISFLAHCSTALALLDYHVIQVFPLALHSYRPSCLRSSREGDRTSPELGTPRPRLAVQALFPPR